MESQSTTTFENVVRLTIQLYEILKRMDSHNQDDRWLDFLILDMPMTKQQKNARQLMDYIVKTTAEQNIQVSLGRSVRPRIKRLITDAIQRPGHYQDFYKDSPPKFIEKLPKDFESHAREEIKILFEYKADRTVDIPLAYLMVTDEPVKFGLITIFNLTEEDRNNDRWWTFVSRVERDDERIRAYAQVISLGDLERSTIYAKTVVNDMLIFMRAVGFPIYYKTHRPIWNPK